MPEDSREIREIEALADAIRTLFIDEKRGHLAAQADDAGISPPQPE